VLNTQPQVQTSLSLRQHQTDQEPLLSQVQTLQLPLSMLQLALFKSQEPEQPYWLQPSAATASTEPLLLK
jgi:hypothetical protein